MYNLECIIKKTAHCLLSIFLAFYILHNTFYIPVIAQNNLEIKMNDLGYEPQNLNITQGDKVIFKNESSEDKWPASNLHPTHGIYPEFDPQTEVKPGESWEFIFDKPGKFKYHDHIKPLIAGEIIVTADPNYKPEPKSSQNPLISLWGNIKDFLVNLFN